MEQLNISNQKTVTNNSFKETFRKHSKDEYKEFFMRGLDNQNGINKVQPWIFVRVFAFSLLIFLTFTFIVFMTGTFIHDGAIEIFGYPSLVTVAGLMINLVILFLAYELYPHRDISFIKVCFVMIVCVIFTDLIVNLGYCIIIPENPWLSNLWAVFIEEFGKALPMIIALVIMKNKNPIFGLLIGAVAGIGMSISEDIGYIFIASWQNNSVQIVPLLMVTLIRLTTSVAGHVIWTGLIGYAFIKFKRPLINIKFWLICILSAGLHYVWNFPQPSYSFIAMVVSALVGLFVIENIIKKERKIAFNAVQNAQKEESLN